MPKMTAVIELSIFSGNQPISLGISPAFFNLLYEGSNISSSEPVTKKPFCCKAKAKLCIAAPPIAIKCICFIYSTYLFSTGHKNTNQNDDFTIFCVNFYYLLLFT